MQIKSPARGTAVALALAFCAAIPSAGAQESAPNGSAEGPSEKPAIESGWEGMPRSVYTKGDQTFQMGVGVLFPLFFSSGSGDALDNNVKLGGTGSLAYSYFLTPNFALGGEVGGSFSETKGRNMLFLMPFGMTATWQFTAGSFEFPATLLLGFAQHSYVNNRGYFGLAVKPGLGAYWRFNPDWSFGVKAAWWFLPEWTDDPATTAYGNFADVTLSARYHF